LPTAWMVGIQKTDGGVQRAGLAIFFNLKESIFFTALKYTVVTAKATRILWRAAAKVTWAPRVAALFVVFRRSIEQVS